MWHAASLYTTRSDLAFFTLLRLLKPDEGEAEQVVGEDQLVDGEDKLVDGVEQLLIGLK